MAVFNRKITGAEILRTDCCTQSIEIIGDDGQIRPLISERDFWGDTSGGEKLYFDYRLPSNKGWAVEQEGWNDYSLDSRKKMSPAKTEEWVNERIFQNNASTLTVIQGYAGCGKTIFVNNQLRERKARGELVEYNNVYVDYDINATECGYLPSAIRNHIISQLCEVLKEDDGDRIYQTFVSFLTRYGQQAQAALSTWSALFRPTGQISQLVERMHNGRNDNESFHCLENDLYLQFVSGTITVSGALKGKLAESLIDYAKLSGIEDQYIKMLLGNYLAIDLILLHSIQHVRKLGPIAIFYDNLDIIDNPRHIVFFIDKLKEVLSKLSSNHINGTIPIFNIILTVRKVTYALLSSFTEVDGGLCLGAVKANFLDISNLYSATTLLKYKANYFLNHRPEHIPPSVGWDSEKDFLSMVVRISDESMSNINLPELFNHNIRACSNILYSATKGHYADKDIKALSGRLGSSIWINNICAVLQKNDVWVNLGYNVSDKQTIHYPTTLSRLILTYLYNQRFYFRNNYENVNSTEVSFREIIKVFEKLPFDDSSSNTTEAIMGQNAQKRFSTKKTRDKIIFCLSNMLKRNMDFDSINPDNEMELWRRPIYFTKNAFPLIDENGNDNVRKELKNQLQNLGQPNSNTTEFCITDEGYTFIEKIATHFEFYSVRYNGINSKPLCYLTTASDIDAVVDGVYTQIERCVTRQLWLQDYYIKKYISGGKGISVRDTKSELNEYLGLMFHPRTEKGTPQLHIVRTIYDHINYLNDYRDYLIESGSDLLSQLNKTLVKWIGKYLELYRSRLYTLLDGTIGSYNDVFLDLKYLYWRTIRDEKLLPMDEVTKKTISIRRSGVTRKDRELKIDDRKLRENPMLISDDD